MQKASNISLSRRRCNLGDLCSLHKKETNDHDIKDFVRKSFFKASSVLRDDHSGNWVKNRFEGGKTDSQQTILGKPGDKLRERLRTAASEMAEWVI